MENGLSILKEEYDDKDFQKIKEGYRAQRYSTFRINTLKTTKEKVLKELQSKGFEYDTVSWYENAIIIKNKTKQDLQELPMFQKGEIYLQSLSSMIPPLVLNPQKNEAILDMTAAPGSKTTQMGIDSKNQIMITACEKNLIRYERLKYNLKLQNVTCCTTLKEDANSLDDCFSFDKILLDAPCSGSGTISFLHPKDYSTEEIKKYSEKQQKLFRKALTLLKKGHIMVYSTCSLFREENEKVLEQMSKEFSLEIIPIKIDQADFPVLKSTIPGTILICPTNEYEGFFVALIKKL